MAQTPSPYAAPNSNDNYGAPAVGVGDWILTMIVLMIPLVNLVMLFVWGFSRSTNPSKANFCKAYLIIMAAVFVLILLIGILMPSVLTPAAQ
ncbi:MAG: hypothetical protein Q4G42_05625 [Neisseria sp.]|nr:hypothetical protein [Neisseria sp.]